jgi:hypothetical protein
MMKRGSRSVDNTTCLAMLRLRIRINSVTVGRVCRSSWDMRLRICSISSTNVHSLIRRRLQSCSRVLPVCVKATFRVVLLLHFVRIRWLLFVLPLASICRHVQIAQTPSFPLPFPVSRTPSSLIAQTPSRFLCLFEFLEAIPIPWFYISWTPSFSSL